MKEDKGLTKKYTTTTTTTTNNSPQAAWGQHSYARPSSIPIYSKPSLFTHSQDVLISFKSFFMMFSHPRRRRPSFRLALDGWPKRKIFGNMSSFIHTKYSNHLNLSFIIAQEHGIEPHFLHSPLFEIRSVRWVPRTIHRQFTLFPSKTSNFAKSPQAGAASKGQVNYIVGFIGLKSDITEIKSNLSLEQWYYLHIFLGKDLNFLQNEENCPFFYYFQRIFN
jgi:hypothetical protein